MITPLQRETICFLAGAHGWNESHLQNYIRLHYPERLYDTPPTEQVATLDLLTAVEARDLIRRLVGDAKDPADNIAKEAKA